MSVGSLLVWAAVLFIVGFALGEIKYQIQKSKGGCKWKIWKKL